MRSEFRTRAGTLLFCKNNENAVKINKSPRITAFTAKRCTKQAMKTFHRTSHEYLPPNLYPGGPRRFLGQKIKNEFDTFIL